MPKTTTASPGGPRWTRQRDKRAGWYHAKAGATKNVARQIGLSIRRAQQMNSGEAPGVPQWLAEHVDALVCGDRTSPYPLLASVMELIVERTSEAMTPENIHARMLEVCRMETEQQGRIDCVQLDRRTDPTCRETLERIRDLAPIQAIALLEMSALAGVQIRRMGR